MTSTGKARDFLAGCARYCQPTEGRGLEPRWAQARRFSKPVPYQFGTTLLAAGLGFEPREPFGPTGFKPAAFVRSANPPGPIGGGRRIRTSDRGNRLRLSTPLPSSARPSLRAGAGGLEPPRRDPKSRGLPLADAPVVIQKLNFKLGHDPFSSFGP